MEVVKYYDDEILEVLQASEKGKSICIQSITGSGKSQSIMEFVRRNPNKKSLLIFSTIKEQKTFYDELGEELCDYWNSESKINFYKKLEEFNQGSISITKQKFMSLIINEDLDVLNSFDYIFYDEFGSLNPCLVEDLISKLSEIQKCSSEVFSLLDKRLYEGLDFIYRDINNRAFMSITIEGTENKLFNRVFKLECTDEYISIANEILQNLKRNKNEEIKTKLNLTPEIKLMLHSIANNKLYISAYEVKNKGKIIYNVLGVNDLIKEFIKQYKGRFFIMDATASLVSDVYKYLGVEIFSDFTKNKNKTYEHVNIKLFNLEDVSPKDFRVKPITPTESTTLIKDEDKLPLDKISGIIKSRKIVTFVPKAIKETFQAMYGYDFEKVFHFFSGFDIGSNDFRNETELNIIALQTYPKTQRVLYNHIIKGKPLEIANSSRHDEAEYELLSSLLVQNINRSKSRVYDCTEEININLICVPKHIAENASYFMKGSNFINVFDVKGTEFNSRERILNCIGEYLKTYNDEKDVIELDVFLIKRGFYNSLKEMSDFVESKKQDIMKVVLQYGFYLKVEDSRPYLYKIQNTLTTEDFLLLDKTKNKLLNIFVEIKTNHETLLIKDLKSKYNIKTHTFTKLWKDYEKYLEDYGIYRLGNLLVIKQHGYNGGCK